MTLRAASTSGMGVVRAARLAAMGCTSCVFIAQRLQATPV